MIFIYSQRSNISITEEQIIDLNDKEKDLNQDDNSSKIDNAKTENLESLKDIKDKKSDDLIIKLNFEFIEASNREESYFAILSMIIKYFDMPTRSETIEGHQKNQLKKNHG